MKGGMSSGLPTYLVAECSGSHSDRMRENQSGYCCSGACPFLEECGCGSDAAGFPFDANSGVVGAIFVGANPCALSCGPVVRVNFVLDICGSRGEPELTARRSLGEAGWVIGVFLLDPWGEVLGILYLRPS